jgi:DNA polymerase III gamma/tau subunit
MTSEVIIDRLFKISAAEGIDLTEDGARLIARASRGGMRDAVSLLELCAGSRERVDAELVASTIGSGDRAMVYKLVEALGKSDYDTVYTVIRDTVMKSGDISVFWQELIDSYRDLMVVKNSSNAKSYLDLTDVEYKNLVNIASLFTMPHLAYHASLLESANHVTYGPSLFKVSPSWYGWKLSNPGSNHKWNRFFHCTSMVSSFSHTTRVHPALPEYCFQEKMSVSLSCMN